MRILVAIVTAHLKFLALSLFLSGTIFANDELTICSVGEGESALLIKVTNIRFLEGNIRAQTYSSNPDEFLANGKKLERLDFPVVSEGAQDVCLPIPKAGTYALVVMHDRNKNGKADFFTEGFGFSNNPKLRFSPPDAREVMIEIPKGVLTVPVELYYLLGTDAEEVKKRRKLRRR